jgi:hypothetical protein
MGRQAPGARTEVAVEAESAGSSQGREDGNGLQERRMLRGKLLRLLWQEQDDYPGTQKTDRK